MSTGSDAANSGGKEGIEYFARSPLLRLYSQISGGARRRMYATFVRLIAPAPDARILDVGVTPNQALAEANFFEAAYPHPENITATSVEDASFLERRYPGLRFMQTDGVTLPFRDAEFDVVVSFAVVEHVGDRARQAAFARELLRVGRRVFITTPDRAFPMEVHTYLPFLHWLPQRAYQAALRALGLTFHARTENLNLLFKRDFAGLFPAGSGVRVTEQRLAGISSNLIAYR